MNIKTVWFLDDNCYKGNIIPDCCWSSCKNEPVVDIMAIYIYLLILRYHGLIHPISNTAPFPLSLCSVHTLLALYTISCSVHTLLAFPITCCSVHILLGLFSPPPLPIHTHSVYTLLPLITPLVMSTPYSSAYHPRWSVHYLLALSTILLALSTPYQIYPNSNQQLKL